MLFLRAFRMPSLQEAMARSSSSTATPNPSVKGTRLRQATQLETHWSVPTSGKPGSKRRMEGLILFVDDAALKAPLSAWYGALGGLFSWFIFGPLWSVVFSR